MLDIIETALDYVDVQVSTSLGDDAQCECMISRLAMCLCH